MSFPKSTFFDHWEILAFYGSGPSIDVSKFVFGRIDMITTKIMNVL